jgi:hypothetical protein
VCVCVCVCAHGQSVSPIASFITLLYSSVDADGAAEGPAEDCKGLHFGGTLALLAGTACVDSCILLLSDTTLGKDTSRGTERGARCWVDSIFIMVDLRKYIN